MRRVALAAAVTLAALPAAARAADRCAAAPCEVRLTPAQLLAAAERLVMERRFVEAKPLLTALAMAPGYTLQTRFLLGLSASETGDLPRAADYFKAILADDPRQTRVRLEFAKVLLAMHKPASADRQLRIAQQDDLPPEIARTLRSVRDTIRSARAWRLDVNVGLAPDTNINNATAAQSITVMLGDTPIPLTLDEQAKAKSGTGQTGQISGGLRLPVGPKVSVIADLDASGTNYRGSTFDDYIAQASAGGEYRLSQTGSVSLQAVGAQRWFGGHVASRQIGVRGGGQATLGARDRIGVQIDIRRTNALFDAGYDGWQGGLYATVERAISRTMLVSAGPFLRRDWLREDAFSSTEVGGNLGIGGELRYGINVGASVGLSRAAYDAALPLFSIDPRRDTRMTARATLGNRKLRVLGLSPQVAWTFTRVESSIGFYDTSRSRFEFTLARFF